MSITNMPLRRVSVILQQAVVCLGLSAAVLHAQTPPPAHLIVTSAALDAQQKKLAAQGAADKTGAANESMASAVSKYRTLMFHRDVAGPGEIHEEFSDLGIVRAGSGTLRYGGTLVNRTVPAPGEPKGTAVDGFKTVQLGVGDVFYVPAGMAHQFVPDAGKSLTVMLFKPAGLKPADKPAEFISWRSSELDAMTPQLIASFDKTKGADAPLVPKTGPLADARILVGHREAPSLPGSVATSAMFVFFRKGSGQVTIGTKAGATSVEGGVKHAFGTGDLIYLAENSAWQFEPNPGGSFDVIVIRYAAK
jgi:mannose-6-phosphate isomerase-like protein (cupin superfamily)